MPTVWNGEHQKQVKNLGWILRHAAQVVRVEVQRRPQGEAFFIAHLNDGRIYTAHFASFLICIAFSYRRTFSHAAQVRP